MMKGICMGKGGKCFCCDKSVGLLIIRLAAGLIFLVHGISKLTDIESTTMFFASMGLGAFFAWLVAIVETLGGAMLVLGIFTRKAAAILAVVMIFAIILVKSKMPFNNGEIDIMLLGSMLGLAFMGGGKYSMVSMCKCGGKCMACKDESHGHDGKCDGCGSCAGGTCSGHEMKCDMCEGCKGGCTMHEGK